MKRITSLLVCLLFFGLSVMAQDIQITGKVTSADDGSVLPGVSVVVQGTTTGTTTNIDGEYTITAPSDGVLVFSFVGMETSELPVGGQTVIDLAMKADMLAVEEVVVTAMGISKASKALGYAVQEVENEELNRSTNQNVLNSLNGKMAGVNITSSSGAAGSSAFITIRGVASLTNNNQPLFVIDGIPIDNSQNYSGNPDDGRNNLTDGVAYSNRAIDINPQDIESVSVLKGGAATALYGMRAANGVVVITTKKGEATSGKKINVSFSSSLAIDKISQMPKMQKKYAQGVSGIWAGADGPWYKMLSWGPLLDTMSYDDSDADWNSKWDVNGKLVSENDPSANGKQAQAYDNIDDFFQTGYTWNNNLSFSGGNEQSTFYLSLGNQSSTGVIPNNEFNKTTIKLTGESKIYDRLKVFGSVNYVKSGGKRIQQGSNVSGVMLGLLRTAPTFQNSQGYQFADGTQRNYRGGGGYDNPFWTVNKNLFEDRVNRVFGHTGFNWAALDWLTVNYRVGLDFYSDIRKYSFEIGSRAFSDGQVNDDQHNNLDFNSDLFININRDLTSDLNLNVVLGNNMYSSRYQQLYVQGAQNAALDFYHLSNTGSQLVREQVQEYRTAAHYGDVGLSWKDMIFANGTFRYEWSTTLPKDDNSFPYYSGSLGFVFTELSPLKNNSILSFGKLRASYSEIANTPPVYVTETTYDLGNMNDGSTSGIFFPYNKKVGFQVGDGLGNPGLKPEITKSLEFGADLRFLQNRINLDYTYYSNTHSELLLWVPFSGSTGYTSRYMNAGEMTNKGHEIMLNAIPVMISGFTWDISINFTKNTNKVEKLAEGVENISLGGFTGSSIRAVAGMSYGSMFGSTFVHDPVSGQQIIEDGYPVQSPIEAAFGSSQPDWTSGITNTFTYKDISLSFLIDIREGGIMWNGTRGVLRYFGTHADTENRGVMTVFPGVVGTYNGLNPDGSLDVTTDGTPNTEEVPLDEDWYTGTGSGWYGPSSQFVEETSWVRLRELSLSYNFSKLVEGTFVKGGRVYFTGRNLWLSTDYTGVDPETSLMGSHNAQGLDYFNMPGTKTYEFGLKIDF